MVRRLSWLLVLVCSSLVFAPLARAADSLVPGVDYELIDDGAPYRALAPGQVEVVEVFAYTCPHCAHFAPAVDAWKATLPKNVRFDFAPAAYDLDATLDRAYFASEALHAVGRTHPATFRAIHDTSELASNPTDGELADFYATLGLDRAKVLAALRSPATDARMKSAQAFALRSRIQGTPTLIVNGRYRVEGDSAQAQLQNARRIIDMLSAHK